MNAESSASQNFDFVAERLQWAAFGKNTIANQVKTELASRSFSEGVEVQVVPELTRQLRHDVRRRGHGCRLPPVDVGYGLRLVLSRPVAGPLLLGYPAHFGLGRFGSVEA